MLNNTIQEQSVINARKPWNAPVENRKECIDAQALAWCYLNFDKLSESGFIKKMKIGKTIVTNEVYKQEVKKYLESFDLRDFPLGERYVAYGQGTLKEGRFMARTTLSLQTISRQIRHTISRTTLRDIDVIACHPSIMYYILRPIYNFKFKALGQYLSGDEAKNKIINDLLESNPDHNKESVKTAICAVLNGGGYTTFQNPTDWYIDYHDTAQEILAKIVKKLDETVPAYRADSEAKKGKNYKFLNGSIVNHLLVDYENRIAFYMRQVLESKKFKVAALTHDGCMVQEDERLDEQVLRDIEQILQENDLHGIRLKYKEMDEGFEIPKQELDIIDKDHNVFHKIVNYEDPLVILNCLKDGDEGCSRLFYHKAKSTIKTICKKGFDGYRWNPRKRLWDNLSKEFFINDITGVLYSLLEPFLKRLKDDLERSRHEVVSEEKIQEHEEYVASLKNSLKEWDKILKYINSSKGCKQIWDKARTLFYDANFFETLDNTSDEYPIRGGYKVNLRTKDVSLRTQTDYWTFESPAYYIPGETQDKIRMFKYLKQVCCEMDLQGKDLVTDEEAHYTKFLFKLFGYCLTRETSDRRMYIFHGCGMNSKSVVMDMIANIMVCDKAYSPLSKHAIMKEDRRSGATPELMPFVYARLAVVNETEEKAKLDSVTIKKFTGNDKIRIRALYKDEISIEPKAKIFLISNHKPEFNTEDQAMIDRIVFCPFAQRFEKSPANTEKVQKMLEEDKDHFFSVMVDYGAEWWIDRKLVAPLAVENATNEFIDDNNDIDPWINSSILKAPTNMQLETHKNIYHRKDQGLYQTDAYEHYSKWCEENGKFIKTKGEWKQAMEKRGFSIKAHNGNQMLKLDKKLICLITPVEEEIKEEMERLMSEYS